jgi:thiol-disulfide isomerase/thioredoxin
MKANIIKGVLFFINGITVQYIVSYGRVIQVDYIKFLITIPVFIIAGYIAQFYDKKIWPFSFLFLLSGIGISVFAILINPGGYISWVSEIVISLVSFFTGFFLLNDNRAKKRLLAFFLIAILVSVAFFVNPRIKYRTQFVNHENPEIKNRKLNFAFKTLNGTPISSDSLIGKVVVLDFWFIGCPPCYLKMPDLSKVAKHYTHRKDVVFLTVDAGRKDSFENFKTVVNKMPSNLLYVYDSAAVFASTLKITGYPHEIIINRKGVVVSQLVGYNKDIALIYEAETVKKVDKLLNEN